MKGWSLYGKSDKMYVCMDNCDSEICGKTGKLTNRILKKNTFFQYYYDRYESPYITIHYEIFGGKSTISRQY